MRDIVGKRRANPAPSQPGLPIQTRSSSSENRWQHVDNSRLGTGSLPVNPDAAWLPASFLAKAVALAPPGLVVGPGRLNLSRSATQVEEETRVASACSL